MARRSDVIARLSGGTARLSDGLMRSEDVIVVSEDVISDDQKRTGGVVSLSPMKGGRKKTWLPGCLPKPEGCPGHDRELDLRADVNRDSSTLIAQGEIESIVDGFLVGLMVLIC